MALRFARSFREDPTGGSRARSGGWNFFPWTLFQVFHPCGLRRLARGERRGSAPRGAIRLGRWSAFALALLLAAPLAAKDGLGVFGEWAAFRDAEVPRCYAIAAAEPDRRAGSQAAYADVATWPRRGVRGQVHFRLSRPLHENPRLSLTVGGERFALTGGGIDAWAEGPRADAAIVAAMRSASRMSVSAVDRSGRRFTDRYRLDDAATAMDAATVGCARIRPAGSR